jgi:hypothetical protein
MHTVQRDPERSKLGPFWSCKLHRALHSTLPCPAASHQHYGDRAVTVRSHENLPLSEERQPQVAHVQGASFARLARACTWICMMRAFDRERHVTDPIIARLHVWGRQNVHPSQSRRRVPRHPSVEMPLDQLDRSCPAGMSGNHCTVWCASFYLLASSEVQELETAGSG